MCSLHLIHTRLQSPPISPTTCLRHLNSTMTTPTPSIAVKDLSYKFQDGSDGLEHVSLDLPAGSRTLLIGGTYQSQTQLSDVEQ